MVDNKKQRKSTRSFNMEKHVERHFEIEKEEVPVADTSIKKPDSLIDGSTEENTCTSNNRGKLIAVIVVVLAILAFVAYRSCGSGQEKESEPTNTIVSDSTEKERPDTVSNVNPAKRNVLDLKNETCKNREKRNVLKISRTRHFKTTKKQSRTGCFYSF